MPAHRRPMRHWAPYAGYPQHIVDKAQRLLQARKNGSKISLRSIAAKCGVPSPETIRRWSLFQMTPRARAERSSHKGPQHKLTAKEESIAAGWARYRHGMLLDTSSQRFFQFIDRAFGKKPFPSWLTRFKRRWHLSSRIGKNQYPGLTTAKAYEQGVKFLEQMHTIDKEPSEFLFVDKITFNQGKRTVRQLAPTGRHAYGDNFVSYNFV